MNQPHPMVRVVIVNYRRGDLTVACLNSLRTLDWPAERLDVVVVDNGSGDGDAALIEEQHPWVRVIRSERNLGFAGGNNLALRDIVAFDYVALLNNDTTVGPDWLAPLVAALEDDPQAGAACPKILFAGRFVEWTLHLPPGPDRSDERGDGVRLSGIEVDGVDRWDDAQFPDGWWGLETGPAPAEETTPERYQWSRPQSRLRLPIGQTARLRLASATATTVTLRPQDQTEGFRELAVGPQPRWFELPTAGEAFDVINNAGNRIEVGGYGADRGYLEADRGQHDEGIEVFAWCGASVVLRRTYLDDVGLFDERLFLYYEDLDLSWRGRARGWRYLYVPASAVRHIHSATTIVGSPTSDYYGERNRLAVLAKNAPGPLAWRASGRYLLITASYARRDIALPLLRGRRGDIRPTQSQRRLKAFGGYLRLLPAMLATRYRIRRSPATTAISDAVLSEWMARP